MSENDEDVRAENYRVQLRKRLAFQRALRQKLAGSPEARKRLQDNWNPILKALQEKNNGVGR
jgi:hypothetical protein